MSMDTPSLDWREMFYVTTWRDAQAIRDPQYKPRGQKRHGPFATYSNAAMYAQQVHCTHYSIEKVYVSPNIHPPFIDHTGNREQPALPGVEVPG